MLKKLTFVFSKLDVLTKDKFSNIIKVRGKVKVEFTLEQAMKRIYPRTGYEGLE
jgi:hypothetical protein